MKKEILNTVNSKQTKKQPSKKELKKVILALSLLLFGFSGISKADSYEKAMLTNIEFFKNAETIEQYQEVANDFERIANTEKDKWLPAYYVAHVYIIMSFVEKENDKKDEYLDKAQSFVDKSKELSKNNPEIYVLQGFLYQARVSIDPMSRGQKYSTLANESINYALGINPDNPRAYFLLGQNLLHTPAMFGGGKKAALPLLTKAQEKYKEFTPESNISPNWGEKNTLELIDYCNK